jgi:signal transduction histidine kinase
VTLADGVADVGTGAVLVAAGLVTWARARDTRTGPLLVLTGAAWLAGDLVGVLALAHRGPLVHVLVTFPTGRARARLVLVVVALAYVAGLVPAVARDPWTTVVLVGVVVCTTAWRWRAAQGVERRALLVPVVGAVLVGAPVTLSAVVRLTGTDADSLAAWTYESAIVITAVILATELLSRRSVRAAATGLVVDLADWQEPRALRDALSRTVGDPDLAVAYRVDESWVDEVGQPVLLPLADETERRTVTFVDDGGAPVAAIVHDPAALRDTTLAQSVGAAVRLVLANVRLQTEDAARTREVAASRRRLVETGDEQRRRLREQLRAGPERKLAEVSRELTAIAASRNGSMRHGIVDLVDALDAACADLARFAQGVHPRSLTEQGLRAALGELAAQSAVPFRLDVPADRFPPPQEAAAYFVCSEALANVAKHADASGVSIEVAHAGPRLVVRVADDGRGGADPAHGSGLRGLMDRVEALGGRLAISSPAGAGTLVVAELPLTPETW